MPNNAKATMPNNAEQSRQGGAPRAQGPLIVGGLAGMALGPTLITIGERLGWSARLDPYFFFGGWALMLSCFAIVWRRGRAARSH